MNNPINCKNCSNQFVGNYCNLCGEKVFHERDKSVAHFFDESFHFLTHFDNKFFRSIWVVFTRPAKISTDIVQGIRKKYFKPLNLFLIGVILYLLFPFFQGLNLPLASHLKEGYAPYTRYLVKYKMSSRQLNADEIAFKFNSKSPKFAKVLLLVIIPLSGLALAALFFRNKNYYFDHITLAAELNTVYLYFTFFIMPLAFMIIFFIVRFLTRTDIDLKDNISLPLYSLVFGSYCYMSFIRFYNERKLPALIKSILFLALHMLIVYFLYRIILLSVVFLFI
ncbi:MAG: DUF3667 domain-containing protein [Chitinophagaceae bacterium]|nr:DUF3667 domain-containing protein [Chitinophagaceae bacterium]